MADINNLSIGDIFVLVKAIELAIDSRAINKKTEGRLLEVRGKLLCEGSLNDPGYNPPSSN